VPRALRICIVGGGSYNWGPTLLTDLAVTPGIAGTVVLHDTDPAAAEDLRRLGKTIVAAAGVELEVVTSPDLRESLTGADIVVVTITTGGLEATRRDIHVPAMYGIEQTVGDTVGPGGLARALRNIPVMVDLARMMEEVCPDAWLLNLTNPMATLVRAVVETTRIKTVGLCHEVFGVRRAFAAIMGVERARWS
jgi:alpha-galactosidase